MKVIGKDQKMRKSFLKFYHKLQESQWEKPSDILSTFGSADIVKCQQQNRLVFNVGGNKYRLVCGYHFGHSRILLFIKFVGSHTDYDKIDVCDIDMFGN